MPKATAKETATVNANETGLAVRDAAPLAPVQDLPAPLAPMGEDFSELLDAAAELEFGFEHTKPTDILNRNEPFSLIDAIHTTITDVRDGESYDKSVFVFKLHMASGDVLTMMQGQNKIREKWATPFLRARERGVRIKAGPVQLVTIQPRTKQINDAIAFRPLPGFGITDEQGNRLL